jgi:hypothetical protein
MTKRTELRQRERRIQENCEIAETEKSRSKQLQAQIESLQNRLRFEQANKICYFQRNEIVLFDRVSVHDQNPFFNIIISLDKREPGQVVLSKTVLSKIRHDPPMLGDERTSF